MNPKTVINCPNCNRNSMAEIIFTHYEPGKLFLQTLKCLSCDEDGKTGNVEFRINLTKVKEVANDIGSRILFG